MDKNNLKNIDRFTIIKEIGQGGMGKVYKAYDPRTTREVAIKVLHPKIISAKNKKRFFNEAKAMAKLSHPNIITFYHAATDSYYNFDYIVMDFIEGKVLDDCSLSLREGLEVIKKVALAVEFIHSKGIIHRDLKPPNIMLCNDKTPIIMDFGIAKYLTEQITQSGDIFGSPNYMAPEQALGKNKEVSAATDVYALGAILYQQLTGVKAVQGENIAQILHSIVHKEVISLQKHNPKLSSQLQIICNKALAKEPKNRYPSAKELADDIDRFLDGRIIAAKTLPLYYTLWYKLKKHKIIIAIVAFFLLLFIANFNVENQKQQQQAKKYYRKAQKILEQIPREIKSLQDISTVNIGKNTAKTIESYFKGVELLSKALELMPKEPKFYKQLLQIHKNIGFLALSKKEYLLSFRAFKQCYKFDSKQAAILLKQWKTKKQENAKKDLKRLQKIMAYILNSKLTKKELDWWVDQLLQMKTSAVVKKLFFYIESNNLWQRLLAIRVLGKKGDITTKFAKKDSIKCLLNRLSQLTPIQDAKITEENKHINQEIMEIIWALGWLKTSRANHLVHKIRRLTGDYSLLWHNTKIPYSWLPIAKEKITTAKQFYIRGLMKKEKGNNNGATIDFSMAIKLNPRFVDAYNNRGNAKERKGDFNGALADYAQAIKLDPKFAKAYSNRGMIKHRKGNYDAAIEDYSLAIKLNPSLVALYHNRGSAKLDKKDFRGAIEDYSLAIKFNPNFAETYYNRANALSEQGKLQAAMMDYSKSIKLNPYFAPAYFFRGIIKHKRGKINAALEDYTQAINLRPKYASAHCNRGIIKEQRGFFKEAIEDYTQAIKFNPKYAKAYMIRATAYRRKRKDQLAAKDFHNYLLLVPNAPQAKELKIYIQKYGNK